MIKYTSYKHHFLVAMPHLNDPNFFQSVVLVQEHNHEGALGLIINKPLKVQLKSVLEHLNIDLTNEEAGQQPVLMGGPVSQEQGFVIDDQLDPDEPDQHGYSLSASKDRLSEIAAGKGPDNFLVTLGYSGWKAGQLEQEIANNDWLIVPVAPQILFETPIEQRWQQTASLLGINILHLPKHIGHA